MHRTHDKLRIRALDQIAQLARAWGWIGLGVLSCQFDLAARDAPALIDDIDGRFRGLVVPHAPRRDHAREIAVVADNDRPRWLREGVFHDREMGRPGGRASGEGALEEASAREFPCHGRILLLQRPSYRDSPR